MEQTSVAPSVARAAADLSVGFIAPVAGGGTAELAGRQNQVMDTIRASVAAQSEALSAAAAEILAQPKVEERRFVPLSSAEAVILYAGSFLPSWAGAISIDLLPGVLVAILAVAHAAARRDEDELSDADRISAADMLRALEIQQALSARLAVVNPPEQPAEDEPAPAPQHVPTTTAENVTPLSMADRKRSDP